MGPKGQLPDINRRILVDREQHAGLIKTARHMEVESNATGIPLVMLRHILNHADMERHLFARDW